MKYKQLVTDSNGLITSFKYTDILSNGYPVPLFLIVGFDCAMITTNSWLGIIISNFLTVGPGYAMIVPYFLILDTGFTINVLNHLLLDPGCAVTIPKFIILRLDYAMIIPIFNIPPKLSQAVLVCYYGLKRFSRL